MIDLNELLHIKNEIKQLENRIEKIRNQSEQVGAVVQNGYKKHAVIHGIDITRTYKLNNLYRKYKEFNSLLIEKQNEAEKYIETIPNSETRQIFRLRYIDGFNWIKVAHEMNRVYTRKVYNEDSVRKKHDRFLKKF